MSVVAGPVLRPDSDRLTLSTDGVVMNDLITLTGFVGSVPRHLVTATGVPLTSFRLATTQRRFDRAKNSWVDGDTNWYSIVGFRQLAVNMAGAIAKGDPVVVHGRLRIRDWESDKRQGTNVEVEAESLGHDLLFGTTAFTRSVASSLSGGPGGASFFGAGQGSPVAGPGGHEQSGEAVDGETGDSSGELTDGTVVEPATGGVDARGWALPGGEHPETVDVPF